MKVAYDTSTGLACLVQWDCVRKNGEYGRIHTQNQEEYVMVSGTENLPVSVKHLSDGIKNPDIKKILI